MGTGRFIAMVVGTFKEDPSTGVRLTDPQLIIRELLAGHRIRNPKVIEVDI
jgi:hypothetical protein